MKRFGAAVVICTLLVSCTTAEDRDEVDEAAPPAEETAEEIPSIEGLLEVNEVTPCLYKKRTRPDREAIRTLGLLPWMTSEIEDNRELDLELAVSDIRLSSKSEFEEAVKVRTPKVTDADEEVLKLLAWGIGLSPHGLDVNAFLEGSEARLVAGFYDPETKEIFVRSEEKIKPRTIVVLAHEFAHAAADQEFGLPPLQSKGPIDDALIAERALSEGDASLVEFRFVSRFSPSNAIEKALAAQLAMEDRLEKARTQGVPELMIDELVFPYQWGLAFVCSVYKEEGWDGVNRMYRNPPTTTAEIMFPSRYLDRVEAVEPAPLGRLDAPWERRASGTIGAAHVKSLFEAPGNVGGRTLDKAIARAAAWAGGNYQVWSHEDERFGAIGIALVEHENHQGILCDSMRQWYEAAFEEAEPETIDDQTVSYSDEHQVGVISCVDEQVRVGIAPEEADARAMIQ